MHFHQNQYHRHIFIKRTPLTLCLNAEKWELDSIIQPLEKKIQQYSIILGYIPSKPEPFSTPSEEPFSMSLSYLDISSTISQEPSSANSSDSEPSSAKSNESEWPSSYVPSPVSSSPSYVSSPASPSPSYMPSSVSSSEHEIKEDIDLMNRFNFCWTNFDNLKLFWSLILCSHLLFKQPLIRLKTVI